MIKELNSTQRDEVIEQYVNLLIDSMSMEDLISYVSEWTDWEGVDYETLFNIHQACVINKNNHANSLTLEGV